MQYSCIEERMIGNSYEAVEKGLGEDNDIVHLYRGTDEGQQL